MKIKIGIKITYRQGGIINCVEFHFEVVAGVLYVLKPYESKVHVFLSPSVKRKNYDGVKSLLTWSKARFPTSFAPHRLKEQYGLVILISTDYELQRNKAQLARLNPERVLAVVHNAAYNDVPSLLSLSADLHLLTLSPHVANSLSHVINKPVQWFLPVFPWKPKSADCPHSGGKTYSLTAEFSCLRGFSMQGKFGGSRRNYTGIWDQVVKYMSVLEGGASAQQLFHLNVLGKGNHDLLELPSTISHLVTVYDRLPYDSYYSNISKTLALIPAFASPSYYSTRFSSTIITSLSTGTPVIASKRLLSAYSFLNTNSTFIQGDEEEEIHAMIRIMRIGKNQLLEFRHSLKQLRDDLNVRSYDILREHIEQVCSSFRFSFRFLSNSTSTSV
ncbi:hypothetical protein CEUSTIGMA_g7644.t1 [Chlamydomonas eustigma]|uniref:Glycosyl transferase family 1 domain-containing protein n=1 Tax=Chlamydomonas eustigma TaxID=1157962 RepID=A0A250XAY5_9CHLO|nr:hypothetical protein CEUSTIGMA_g7644.t1 [Chlamydomonas eustigma]|eukprot:GAX80206.1 hypothetical protein CEUSTIGMA_g7644.t1 [Chlamydomonas eustigma]